MSDVYAPEPVQPRAQPTSPSCPEHPYSKLTELGCVMCGGEVNAARDRANGKAAKVKAPKFVMNMTNRAFGML